MEPQIPHVKFGRAFVGPEFSGSPPPIQLLGSRVPGLCANDNIVACSSICSTVINLLIGM